MLVLSSRNVALDTRLGSVVGDRLDDWGRQRELPSVRIISVDDDSHVLKLKEFSRRVA